MCAQQAGQLSLCTITVSFLASLNKWQSLDRKDRSWICCMGENKYTYIYLPHFSKVAFLSTKATVTFANSHAHMYYAVSQQSINILASCDENNGKTDSEKKILKGDVVLGGRIFWSKIYMYSPRKLKVGDASASQVLFYLFLYSLSCLILLNWACCCFFWAGLRI